MNVRSLITEAQVLAGINSFEGNAQDMNLFSLSVQRLNSVLRDMSNDGGLCFAETVFMVESGELSVKLPPDFVRATRLFRRNIEYKIINYNELLLRRERGVESCSYAISGSMLHVARPISGAKLVYSKLIQVNPTENDMDFELAIDGIYHSYLLNRLALDLAIVHKRETEFIKQQLHTSYVSLKSALANNAGIEYADPYAKIARFS